MKKFDKLEDWLKQSGMKKAHLARQCGVEYGTFWRYITGQHPASLEFVCKMYDLTDGAITAQDWLGVYKSTKNP